MKHIIKYSLFENEIQKKSNIIPSGKDFILVRLDGDIWFNVDGILDAIKTKKIFEYPHLEQRATLIQPKHYMHSTFYHTMGDMIDYAKEKNGWYYYKWKQKFGTDKDEWISDQQFDTVFWDEFVFLVSEDLIKFDSYEALDSHTIWKNYSMSNGDFSDKEKEIKEAHPELESLYAARTNTELRTAYRKLVMKWHPDKIGENEIIRLVTSEFLRLKKRKSW